MPNARNITCPINIHGIGRSGTTLLQNIIGRVPYVQTCNETAGLVFCCYKAGESALLSSDTDNHIAPQELPPVLVRSALCTAMASSKEKWSQKLGGIPNQIVWPNISADDLDYAAEPYPFPYSWYWEALRQTFPHSTDILIIRNYRDVIISRNYHSGWDPRGIAQSIAIYYNLMAHPAANITHYIYFSDLISRPPELVPEIFQAIQLIYSEQVLKAFDDYCSASGRRTLTQGRASDFGWDDKYPEMLTPDLDRIITPALRRLEEKYPR